MYRWFRRVVVISFAIAVFGTVSVSVFVARFYADPQKVKLLLCQRFEDSVAGSNLEIGSARIRAFGGMTFSQVSLHVKDASGNESELWRQDELQVVPDSSSFAAGKFRLRKAVLVRPKLSLVCDKQGRWNIASITQLNSKNSAGPLSLRVEAGQVDIAFEDASIPTVHITEIEGQAEVGVGEDISLSLTANHPAMKKVHIRGVVHLSSHRAEVRELLLQGITWQGLRSRLPVWLGKELGKLLPVGGSGSVSLVGQVRWPAGAVAWDGKIEAKMDAPAEQTELLPIGQFLLDGSFDSNTGSLIARRVKVQQVSLHRLLPAVPTSLAEKIPGLESLAGWVDLECNGAGNIRQPISSWQGKFAGKLNRGNWMLANSPYPIQDGSASFEGDAEGLRILESQFSWGPTECSSAAYFPNWSVANASVDLTAKNIAFTEDLFNKLRDREKTLWRRFSPEGAVSLAGKVQFIDLQPRFTGTVYLKENAITFDRFPRRVTGARGKIDFLPEGRLNVDCTGVVGAGTASLTGSLASLAPTSHMDLLLTIKEAQVDAELRQAFAALPVATAEILGKLHGAGKGSALVAIRRREGSTNIRTDTVVDLDLVDFTADYFKYKLDTVKGQAVIRRDQILLKNFLGTCGRDTKVEMAGWIQRDEFSPPEGDLAGGTHLRLDFRALNLPLDSPLRAALPGDWHRVWDHLHPEGAVNLTCRFDRPPDRPVSIGLKLDARQSAITPAGFKYRLEQITGPIEVRNGLVTWKSLQAHHHDTLWQTTGGFVRANGAGGELHFDQLACPRVPLTGDLADALPTNVQQLIEVLKPSRPAERLLVKDFQLEWQTDRPDATRIEIGEGEASFVNTDLFPALGLKQVTGKIKLVDGFVRERPELDLNVAIESVTLASMMANDLSGRLHVRGQDFQFENFRGSFYGGRVDFTTLRARAGPIPEYEARISVIEADLKKYAREAWRTEVPVEGLVNVELLLNGRGPSFNRLNGRGSVNMHQVDVLRLPVFIDQLHFLLAKLPDGQTFDQATAVFRLDGSKVFVDQLKLASPALTFALREKPGLVSLDTGELDLHLITELTRRGLRIPILADTTAFQVKGSLADPKFKPEPLSGLRRILQPVRGTKR